MGTETNLHLAVPGDVGGLATKKQREGAFWRMMDLLDSLPVKTQHCVPKD